MISHFLYFFLGVGKTQFCLSFIASYLLSHNLPSHSEDQNQNQNLSQVLYIDTEGKFSPERYKKDFMKRDERKRDFE